MNALITAVRLFTAAMLFVVLTITVLERPDHDGYQATHLVFMPRRTWEMDQGRGMLYPESHYTGVDLEIMAEELGVDFYVLAAELGVEPSAWMSEDSRQDAANNARKTYKVRRYEEEEYEEDREDGYRDLGPGSYGEYEWVDVELEDPAADAPSQPAAASTQGRRNGTALGGPRVQRAPYEPSVRDDTIPISGLLAALEDSAWQPLPLTSVEFCLVTWRGEVPSPPPRACTPDAA
jgi:hypothetical protein